MAPADYQGIALIIGSVGAVLASVGGITLQILTFMRQGQMMRAAVSRDAKIDEVHDLVNGASLALNAALIKVAHNEGEKAGVETERARAAPTA